MTYTVAINGYRDFADIKRTLKGVKKVEIVINGIYVGELNHKAGVDMAWRLQDVHKLVAMTRNTKDEIVTFVYGEVPECMTAVREAIARDYTL